MLTEHARFTTYNLVFVCVLVGTHASPLGQRDAELANTSR